MQILSEEKRKTEEGRDLKLEALLNRNKAGELACSPHYHSYIELLYCLSGGYEVRLDEKKYIFESGSLLIVNSNEIHEILTLENDSSHIVVKFEPEILYDSPIGSFDVKYVFPFVIKDASPQKLFAAEEISPMGIPELMKNIYEEYEKGGYCFELSVKSDIFRIFLQILRYWRRSGVKMPHTSLTYSEHIKSIKKVLDYIAIHMSEEISAEEMAKLAGLSYAYFSRIFRQIMGKSFNDYLNSVRINEAERLLVATDMSVTEIAGFSGFSSSSYFIKIFERYKKMTPTRYRTNFKK